MEPILSPHQPGQTFNPEPSTPNPPQTPIPPQPVEPQHQPFMSPAPEPVSLPPQSVAPAPQPTFTPPPPPSHHHEPEPPVFNPAANSKAMKKRKWPIVLILVLLLLALGAGGYLGYKWQTAEKNLKDTTSTMLEIKAERDKQNLAPDFEAEYNDKDLRAASCGGNEVGMFDVYVNDEYAVYKYLCAGQVAPVRIGAFQKQKDGTFELTYSSSTTKPMELPSYIYDTDPDYFGETFGATKF